MEIKGLGSHDNRFLKKRKQAIRKSPVQITDWVAGLIVSALPIIVSFLAYLLYLNSDKELSEKYLDFSVNFFAEGNVLWISTSLLSASICAMALKGWKQINSPYMGIIGVIVVVLNVLGIIFYMFNIANPINSDVMSLMSVMSLITFGSLACYTKFRRNN